MNSKFSVKRLVTSWHLWVALFVIIGAILLQGQLGSSSLILGIVLLCPILMMFMMGDSHGDKK